MAITYPVWMKSEFTNIFTNERVFIGFSKCHNGLEVMDENIKIWNLVKKFHPHKFSKETLELYPDIIPQEDCLEDGIVRKVTFFYPNSNTSLGH